MSFIPLSQKELQELLERAESGELDHATISKRQVRILASLHFVLAQNDEEALVPYSNIFAIIQLIEHSFQKRYIPENLISRLKDLENRGYICSIDDNQTWGDNIIDYNKIFYSLTQKGIDLFQGLLETREVLFESNSRNSISSLH